MDGSQQPSTATAVTAAPPASTSTSSSSSSSWESLRREARRLENELDMKLASYGKQYGTAGGTLERDIATLLEKLASVNASLQSDASLYPRGNHAVLAQRHADILQDYSTEYRRLVTNTSARMELLRGAGDVRSSSGQNASNKGLLLRERTTLDRAHSGIDGVVQQAYGVASGLSRQRDIFSGVEGRLGQLGLKFPVGTELDRRRAFFVAIAIAIAIASLLTYHLSHVAGDEQYAERHPAKEEQGRRCPERRRWCARVSHIYLLASKVKVVATKSPTDPRSVDPRSVDPRSVAP